MDYNFITELVIEYCKDHKCPFWEDKKIYDNLKYLDKQDGGNRAQEYFLKCHTPEFIYRPAWGHKKSETALRCRPNDYRSTKTCEYSNPEALKEITERLKLFGNELNELK